MALIGARGIAFVVCFLVTAGIVEYFIILHIHSGSVRVQFSDWDNPKIRDGFSKVGSVEVENVQAKIEKIKFFPPGHNEEEEDWMKRKHKLLKDWAGVVDSSPKKENVNEANLNIEAPPSPLPSKNHQQEVARQKQGGEGKWEDGLDNKLLGIDGKHPLAEEVDEVVRGEKERDEEWLVQKRAIDKKADDYSHDEDDEDDLDEHGRPKNSEGKKESVVDQDQKGDRPVNKFEKAAQALMALGSFKKIVSEALTFSKGTKEKDKHGEKKGDVPEAKEKAVQPLVETVLDAPLQNSAFYNGRAEVGEILVESNIKLKSRHLTPFEAAGNTIMFTLRTTKPFHDKRLPLLFETWMSKANHSNIFIVTDGEDEKWLKKCWSESKERKERDLYGVVSHC